MAVSPPRKRPTADELLRRLTILGPAPTQPPARAPVPTRNGVLRSRFAATTGLGPDTSPPARERSLEFVLRTAREASWLPDPEATPAALSKPPTMSTPEKTATFTRRTAAATGPNMRTVVGFRLLLLRNRSSNP